METLVNKYKNIKCLTMTRNTVDIAKVFLYVNRHKKFVNICNKYIKHLNALKQKLEMLHIDVSVNLDKINSLDNIYTAHANTCKASYSAYIDTLLPSSSSSNTFTILKKNLSNTSLQELTTSFNTLSTNNVTEKTRMVYNNCIHAFNCLRVEELACLDKIYNAYCDLQQKCIQFITMTQNTLIETYSCSSAKTDTLLLSNSACMCSSILFDVIYYGYEFKKQCMATILPELEVFR